MCLLVHLPMPFLLHTHQERVFHQAVSLHQLPRKNLELTLIKKRVSPVDAAIRAENNPTSAPAPALTIITPPPTKPQLTSPNRAAALATPVDPVFRNLSPSFRKGLTDRTTLEQWFSSQTGDFKAGAEFWAGQRSLPNPDTCHQQSEAFQSGCMAAQEKFAVIDVLRKSEPDYRAGWNAFVKPTEFNR